MRSPIWRLGSFPLKRSRICKTHPHVNLRIVTINPSAAEPGIPASQLVEHPESAIQRPSHRIHEPDPESIHPRKLLSPDLAG
jgi:hypothetical protein